MAKKFIKSFLPHPEKLKQNRWLKLFGRYLVEPNLWRLHRRSVARAFSIGLFITYIPAPGHMILSTLLAIITKSNLPISIALTWVINPLTFIPMFGFAYTIGATILGIPLTELHFEWSLLKDMWPPLILGSLICGTTLAIIGNVGIRLYWRYSIIKAWRNRGLKRAAQMIEIS